MTWFVGQGTDLWHTAVKAVLLFLVAVVGFRFGERRTFAQLAPFDFVAVVSVGAIVGRTATARDAAFLVGVVALVAVLVTHRVVARLRRHRPVAALVDQPLRLLIADGRTQESELRRSGLTRDDLYGVLRNHGVAREADVRYLVYENKGAFSVVRWDQPIDQEPVASALRAAGRGAGSDGVSEEPLT
jgi:uncharacterized membrane protein YcaP (DUF421 family)